MERGDIAVCLLVFLLLLAAGIGMWAMTDASNNRMDEYNDPNNSADYLGDGMYACPNCNWTGYVGLMVAVEHNGLLTYYILYYCPECGYEIDVRGD